MALYDLAGRRLQDSYQFVTQVSKSSVSPDMWDFADGLGNPVYWFNGTASYALTAAFAENTKAAGIEWDIQLNSASATDGRLGVAELGRGYYNWNVGGWTFGIRNTGSTGELVGSWSFAINSGSIALGPNSFVNGVSVAAIGTGSHAEGIQTSASGDYSHAEGATTITYGSGSHAEGYLTIASGSYSHAEGGNTIALGIYSHAEGSGSLASGSYSHAEGWNTIANGSGSHAEGQNTYIEVLTDFAHAEGGYTYVRGDYSHAEGYGTTASYDGKGPIANHAEGRFTKAIGTGASHAEGEGTIAEGGHSHAEGWYTIAHEFGSHSEGYKTIASGSYSHAEGSGSITIGSASHAEGWNTIASGNFQSVVGRWNLQNNIDDYFVVGDGTNNANRSNALGVNATRFYASNSIFFPDLPNTFYPHLLVYDTASKEVRYFTGSAFGGGGGGGGSTVPGGDPGQIQFNNAGAFGGVPTLTYDGTLLRATGSFTGSFTGSLFGTASWAQSSSQALTASFVTASNVFGPYGSNSILSASYASSSTFAATASFVTASNVFGPYGSNSILSSSVISIATDNGNTQHKVIFTNTSVASNGQQLLIDPSSGEFTYNPNQHLLTVTASWAQSSSRAITSSYALTGGTPLAISSSVVGITSDASAIIFTGSLIGGVSSGTGNAVTVNIPGMTIQDEGSLVYSGVNTLNFTGAGVAASYAGGTGVNVTVTGVSAGVSQIIAGTSISISPGGGTGVVTINASGVGPGTFPYLAYFNNTNNVVSNTIRYDSVQNTYFVEGNKFTIKNPPALLTEDTGSNIQVDNNGPASNPITVTNKTEPIIKSVKTNLYTKGFVSGLVIDYTLYKPLGGSPGYVEAKVDTGTLIVSVVSSSATIFSRTTPIAGSTFTQLATADPINVSEVYTVAPVGTTDAHDNDNGWQFGYRCDNGLIDVFFSNQTNEDIIMSYTTKILAPGG